MRPRGDHPHQFPEHDHLFINLVKMTVLDMFEPFFPAHIVQQVGLSDMDRSFDAMTTEKTEPFRTDELTISHQAQPAFRWQGLKKLQHQPHSGGFWQVNTDKLLNYDEL